MLGVSTRPDPPEEFRLGSVPLHERPSEEGGDAKAISTTKSAEVAPPPLPAVLCSKVKGQFEDAGDGDEEQEQVAIAQPTAETEDTTPSQTHDEAPETSGNSNNRNSNPLDFLAAACNQANTAEQPSIPKPVSIDRRVSTTTCAATRSLLELATSVVSLTKNVPCKTAIGGKRRAQKSWQKRFGELVEFKKIYGHVNLRQDSKSSQQAKELAAWLANSRCRYRAGKLNPERAERLHRMGCEGFGEKDASMTGSERQEQMQYDPEYEEEEDSKPASLPDRAASLEEKILLARALERRSMPPVLSSRWGGAVAPTTHPTVQALMERQIMLQREAPVRRGADPDGALPCQEYPKDDSSGGAREKKSSSAQLEEGNPLYHQRGALSSAAAPLHGLPSFLPGRPGMSLLQPLQTAHPRMDPRLMAFHMHQQQQQQQQSTMQALIAREHLMMQQRRTSNGSSQNTQPSRSEEEAEFSSQLQRQQDAARQSLLAARRRRAAANAASRNAQPNQDEEDEMAKATARPSIGEEDADSNMQSEGDESASVKPRAGKRGPKKPWEERMMEMREYFLTFGHVQVPTRGPHKELGRWLSCTRGKARAGTLKPERMEEYLSMNEWKFDRATVVALAKPSVPPSSMRRADPPEEGPALGYRYNVDEKDNKVTPEANASNGINKRKRTRVPYEKRLEQLKAFIQKNGHCNVRSSSDDEFEESLGRWLVASRCRFRAGQFHPERAEELRQLGCTGFEPNEAFAGMSDDAIRAATPSPAPEDGYLSDDDDDDDDVEKEGAVKRRKKCKVVYQPWDEMFEELRAYSMTFGRDATVPRPDGEGGKLGRWLLFQRRLFLNGKLRSDRLAKLKTLNRPEFMDYFYLEESAATEAKERQLEVQ